MSGHALQIFVMRAGSLLATEIFPEGVYVIGSDPSSTEVQRRRS